jgi:hypothetical protein
MTENILTIVFGCLATVLAIAGIVLACLQFRTHIRRSAHDTTPSAMENASSLELTTFSENRLASGAVDCHKILPIMIFDGLVLAAVCHCARCSTCFASLTE